MSLGGVRVEVIIPWRFGAFAIRRVPSNPTWGGVFSEENYIGQSWASCPLPCEAQLTGPAVCVGFLLGCRMAM